MADRQTLKGFFEKGEIPTEEEFAELIDSSINKDDQNPPISLGTLRLGGFTNNEETEWPNFSWLRDFSANPWDEGLMKINGERTGTGNAGFGIHFQAGRSFGFYTTGYTRVLRVEADKIVSKAGFIFENQPLTWDYSFGPNGGPNGFAKISERTGNASIFNDGSTAYNALMILGRKSGDEGRIVKLYDKLIIHNFAESGDEIALEIGQGNLKLANGNIVTSSSRLFKKNISDLQLDQALEIIKGLTPVSYNFKEEDDDSLKRIGFIAEDVPEQISTSDKKSILPINIIPVLTTIVKQQQIELDSLKKIIADHISHG